MAHSKCGNSQACLQTQVERREFKGRAVDGAITRIVDEGRLLPGPGSKGRGGAVTGIRQSKEAVPWWGDIKEPHSYPSL